MFNIKQSSYILLFLVLTCSVSAKSINRQAYKVCQTNEEAYWNGSSAQCCDTTTHELVKNYKNGVGEAGYACCQIKKDEKITESYYQTTKTNYVLVGAANGSCCGGYTSYYSMDYSISSDGYWTDRTSSFSVRENGGTYFCAEEYTESAGVQDNLRYTADISYESNSRWCAHEIQGGGREDYACFCSNTGDPKNGEYCS